MVAVVLSLGAMRLRLVLVGRTFGQVVYVLVGLVLVASVTEMLLQKMAKREIKPRIVTGSNCPLFEKSSTSIQPLFRAAGRDG